MNVNTTRRAYAIVGSALFLPLISLAAQNSPLRERVDSAAILEAVWRQAVSTQSRLRATQLWVPTTADTSRVLAMSAPLRRLLLDRGMPLTDRQTAGDDTVTFHIANWQNESGAILVEVHSSWTTVLGAAPRRCRTGSGNVEQFRVTSLSGTWTAVLTGPVMHGDRVCTPIPPHVN